MTQRSEGDVLTVNTGSSSTKVSLVHPDDAVESHDLDSALADSSPSAVAHRVVHGGDRTAAVVVDDAVLDELRGLTELDPLHQPAALDAMERARASLPAVPHVACFDTAFHRTIPADAATYALPEPWRETLRVKGFHGLSHAWAARTIGRLVPEADRVLVAHLGSGASLCAVRDGRSVDTTMGFTPLGGLVMGTRSGDVDPGALLWLTRHADVDLEDLLERRSGLLGLAGTSDLREVLRRRDGGDELAAAAFDVYLHRLTTCTGAMVAALRGLDVLVFTGGVGENSRAVRQALCARLGWLGVRADESLARPPGGAAPSGGEDALELTADGAAVRVLVLRSREDLQMAAETRALLGW